MHEALRLMEMNCPSSRISINCSAIVIAYVRLRNGESRPRHDLSAKVVDRVALLKPSQTIMFVDEGSAQT